MGKNKEGELSTQLGNNDQEENVTPSGHGCMSRHFEHCA